MKNDIDSPVARGLCLALFAITATAGVHAQIVTNGDFSQGLTGWTLVENGGLALPGDVDATSGAAVFTEGDSFLVTLSQSFVIPTTAVSLTFDFFATPGFDISQVFIPDAFEVSLTDAAQNPVVPAWDPFATSYFNVQEDGAVLLGAATSFDGQTVTVDLTGVPPGTPVTLTFSLIGADPDHLSGVTIDDVALNALCLQPTAGWLNYGAGFPGFNGIPTATLSGTPLLGSTVTLDFSNTAGLATTGCILIGIAQSSLTFPPLPGTFYVDPLAPTTMMYEIPIPMSGASVPLTIPFDAAACGVTAYVQLLLGDLTVLGGYSYSSGLEITLGG